MEENTDFKENEKVKKPEFVYIETEHFEEKGGSGGFQEEFQHSYQKMEGKTYPYSVRIACFVGAAFLLLFILLMTPFLLLFFGINLATLFKWDQFFKRTCEAWENYKKMCATALGLLIGVFSPAFGLSVIMVYFMMRGQKSDEVWVNRIFEARFKK